MKKSEWNLVMVGASIMLVLKSGETLLREPGSATIGSVIFGWSALGVYLGIWFMYLRAKER